MKWPWQRAEKREAIGGYTQIISQLIGAQAAGTTQQASATAAVESVAGSLSRTFAGAEVVAASDIAEAVSPRCLGQIGRDLVRVGGKPSRPAKYGRADDPDPRKHLVF